MTLSRTCPPSRTWDCHQESEESPLKAPLSQNLQATSWYLPGNTSVVLSKVKRVGESFGKSRRAARAPETRIGRQPAPFLNLGSGLQSSVLGTTCLGGWGARSPERQFAHQNPGLLETSPGTHSPRCTGSSSRSWQTFSPVLGRGRLTRMAFRICLSPPPGSGVHSRDQGAR